jgi:L-threonylcarbamoyladenylate synthase
MSDELKDKKSKIASSESHYSSLITHHKKRLIRTQIFKVDPRRPTIEAVHRTVRALENGGVVVFPTDTVYGVAASVFRPQAVARIYRLKGRSYKKPLPLLVAGFDQARALVEPISRRLMKLLDDYWPGPLTVVFKTSDLGKWATGGKPTVAIRIPDHPVTLAILRAANIPLATTSANPSGRPPAATGRAAARIFRNRVDVLVDAGPCPGGEPSTVLDASSFAWTLVREGAVKKKELLKYLDL